MREKGREKSERNRSMVEGGRKEAGERERAHTRCCFGLLEKTNTSN